MSDPTPLHGFQFVEPSYFSHRRESYLTDSEFMFLQAALIANPDAGDPVPGGGGVRKLRWHDARRGKGKRGWLRIIYYCFLSEEEIWLMSIYDKNEAADLTSEKKEQLRWAMETERAARKRR